jgi:putative transposase
MLRSCNCWTDTQGRRVSRFNQCLQVVKDALAGRRIDPASDLPWTGFDLINAFNAWKKTEAAGRIFAVDSAGVAEVRVIGLAWRNQVCQQVFEEAAVDCGRALSACSGSRRRNRTGRQIGFPRFKKKMRARPAFRLRNKYSKGGRPSIRIGQTHPRSVTLPGIGTLRVHDDTRRLR